MMMLDRDVGHDPEREDREALEAAAREEVEEAEGALGRWRSLADLLDRHGVDAGHADGDAEPVDDDHQAP